MKPTTYELIGATLVIVPVGVAVLVLVGILVWEKLKAWRDWWQDVAGFWAFATAIALILWALHVLIRYLQP